MTMDFHCRALLCHSMTGRGLDETFRGTQPVKYYNGIASSIPRIKNPQSGEVDLRAMVALLERKAAAAPVRSEGLDEGGAIPYLQLAVVLAQVPEDDDPEAPARAVGALLRAAGADPRSVRPCLVLTAWLQFAKKMPSLPPAPFNKLLAHCAYTARAPLSASSNAVQAGCVNFKHQLQGSGFERRLRAAAERDEGDADLYASAWASLLVRVATELKTLWLVARPVAVPRNT